MEELQEFSEKEESNFDLKAEIYKYLTHWKWLVFSGILGLTLAYLYNRYTIPEYRTEATMMILSDAQNTIARSLPSGGILTLGNSTLNNQIETLRSKRLVENVVEELDLNVTYKNEGNIIATEAYRNSPVIIHFLSPDSIVQKTSKSFFVTPESATRFILTEASSENVHQYKFGEIISFEGLNFTLLPRVGNLENFNTINIIIRP